MQILSSAPTEEVIGRIAAATAPRSFRNYAILGPRTTFQGDLRGNRFSLEWIPKVGVLWGPHLIGCVEPHASGSVMRVALRPTFKVFVTAAITAVAGPLAIISSVEANMFGAAVFASFVLGGIVAMNVYVTLRAQQALREVVAGKS